MPIDRKPKAAPAYFPYDHLSLDVVWRREALEKFLRLPLDHRRGRTVEQFMDNERD
jgi:hypothetical protein